MTQIDTSMPPRGMLLSTMVNMGRQQEIAIYFANGFVLTCAADGVTITRSQWCCPADLPFKHARPWMQLPLNHRAAILKAVHLAEADPKPTLDEALKMIGEMMGHLTTEKPDMYGLRDPLSDENLTAARQVFHRANALLERAGEITYAPGWAE